LGGIGLQTVTIFEYLSVAVSIVLGLGLAQVLGGLSSVARSWKTVTPYWVHTVWVFMILLLHVQVWWAFWDFSGDRTWTLANFTAILAMPAFLYFLAHLVAPDVAPGAATNLRSYFADIRIPFFVVLASFWAYGMVFRTLAFGDPLFELRRVPQASLFILALAGAAKDSPRWQAVVLLFYLVAWTWLLAFRFALGAYSG
jgi:hypothetical protein